MDAIIFVGLQGSGKSSFYKERFFSTHMRISLDLLRTRHREVRLLDLCLQTQQPFVVDNTNPPREERVKYVEAAKRARFRVTGFYFRSKVEECLARNRLRTNAVPDVGVLSNAKKLELNREETTEFFTAATGIMSDYQPDKSLGRMQDGWDLTLEITSKAFKKSVHFRDQDDPVNGPPGFDVLSRIINRHLKEEKFPE